MNIAMALERSDDLNVHDSMQGRSKKQGYERDLLCMLFFCPVRYVRLERKRYRRIEAMKTNVDQDRWTKHARSGRRGNRDGESFMERCASCM